MGSYLCLLKVAPNSMRTTKEPILLPNCSLFCSPTYDIEDKVWFVLTDSGPNMVKGNKFL